MENWNVEERNKNKKMVKKFDLDPIWCKLKFCLHIYTQRLDAMLNEFHYGLCVRHTAPSEEHINFRFHFSTCFAFLFSVSHSRFFLFSSFMCSHFSRLLRHIFDDLTCKRRKKNWNDHMNGGQELQENAKKTTADNSPSGFLSTNAWSLISIATSRAILKLFRVVAYFFCCFIVFEWSFFFFLHCSRQRALINV